MKRFIHGITCYPILGIFITALFFTSCRKNDNSTLPLDVSPTLESMENDASADYSYSAATDDALDIAMKDLSDENFGFNSPNDFNYPNPSPRLVNGRIQRCFTVETQTPPGSYFPATVTINFPDGCIGRDGRKRKGKITTIYTGKMRISGSSATTTFQDFYLDDTIKIEGTHILTNITTNINTPTFKRDVNNGKVTWMNSGRWTNRTFTRIIAMTKGFPTPGIRFDDEFTITGSGGGENSRGITWTHNIIQGLIRKTACFSESRFAPSSGIINFTYNGVVGSLDYGDGTCDRKAILTVNGKSREITLR